MPEVYGGEFLEQTLVGTGGSWATWRRSLCFGVQNGETSWGLGAEKPSRIVLSWTEGLGPVHAQMISRCLQAALGRALSPPSPRGGQLRPLHQWLSAAGEVSPVVLKGDLGGTSQHP